MFYIFIINNQIIMLFATNAILYRKDIHMKKALIIAVCVMILFAFASCRKSAMSDYRTTHHTTIPMIGEIPTVPDVFDTTHRTEEYTANYHTTVS